MTAKEISRIRKAYAEYERIGRWNDDNPAYQPMLQERQDTLKRILMRQFGSSLSECRILDVGCGNGGMLGWLNECGVPSSNLFGIDLLLNPLEAANQNYPTFYFHVCNAEYLPFPDASFDIVLAFTVFSSVLDESMKKNMAREMTRVLKHDGVIAWYDIRFPNPWNPNVRAMTKSRIRRLFPQFTIALETTTLLPPLAYRLGKNAKRLYFPLSQVAIFRSHYIGLLRRSRGPNSESSAVGNGV